MPSTASLLLPLYLLSGIVLASCMSNDDQSPSDHSTRPNVIHMVVDDLGWNDVGYHDPQIQTPFLDHLASQGIKLDAFYVYRFCSPSRSAFMTGRYPHHLGQQTAMNLNPTPGIACGINLTYTFLPELMKEAGYNTFALGKWHLGYLSNHYTPTYRGFDQYVGYYSGAEEHFTHEKQGGDGYNAFDLSNNTGAHISPLKTDVGTNGTYSVYIYGNETLRHIRAQQHADRPFYLYLAWNVVHDPNQAPQYYIDKNKHIDHQGRRLLAAMMSALDDAVKAIVSELKATGLYSNTIIFFTTDNGGSLEYSGNNYPLRGGKMTFWEGGVRGIGFVHSPLLPAGRKGTTWSGLMHATDIYPTIAGLGGANLTNSGPIALDGFNMWQAILDNDTSPRQHVIININSFTPNGTRLGTTQGVVRDRQYKLIQGYPGWGNASWDGWVKPPSMTNSHQLHLAQGEPYPGPKPCDARPCLFDLVQDPTEHHDVAEQLPHIVDKLTGLLTAEAETEQSVQQSGLCPTKYGTSVDPRCSEEARRTGFWEPWLDTP